MFEEYAYELEYDTGNIENMCNKCRYKNKDLDYVNILTSCRLAYIQTITKDKTIDAEAFVDNIVKEFNKISK
jgi:hypothetical protein